MKTNNARVVVITNDSLMSSLSEHNIAHSAKSNSDNIDFVFFNDAPDKKELSASDAIIFDIDTANSPKEYLSRIFEESKRKPIILTGDRANIKTLTSAADVKYMIHRAIPKPVSIPVFEIAIATATANKTSHATRASKVTTSNKSYQPLVAGSLLTIGIAGAIVYTIFNGEPHTDLLNKSLSDPIAYAEAELEQENTQDKQLNEGDSKAQRSAQLMELATQARSAGRLALPPQENAIYYYQQALLIDRYDSQAYNGLQIVIAEVRAALPRIITTGKLDTAAQLLDVLKEIAPFAPENRYLINSYEAAVRALESNQNAISNIPSSETDLALKQKP